MVILMLIMLMFDDDYDGDFNDDELLLATNYYMQIGDDLMVYACIEKC